MASDDKLVIVLSVKFKSGIKANLRVIDHFSIMAFGSIRIILAFRSIRIIQFAIIKSFWSGGFLQCLRAYIIESYLYFPCSPSQPAPSPRPDAVPTHFHEEEPLAQLVDYRRNTLGGAVDCCDGDGSLLLQILWHKRTHQPIQIQTSSVRMIL